ncbi:MAG: polysaccharide biosynthesis tyrosine autokinase [Acidobacteriia bacterium]|nr:polysaccharide biosynthesis tyrosine autokinase [Terriglobia bacterium]
MVIAVLFSFSMSPEYQGRASLELQTPPAASYGARDGDGESAINGPNFDSYLDTQIGILQSDTLIRRVIARLNLAQQMKAYMPQGLAALRVKYLSMLGITPPATSEEIFEAAKRNLVVHQARLNNLVEILYNAHDPTLAADFVNTLADEYQQQNLEARWQTSQSAGNWFARHLTDLRSQLEASENALQSYSRDNGLLLVSDNNSVAKEHLSQLQEALSRAQSERMARQSQMEMSANSTPDSVPQVLDNTALKEYEVKISDLERQLAEYKQLYTPTNPKLQILQSQIASLESAFAKQQSSVLARVSNEYKAALRNESMLAAAYAAQKNLVTDQDEKMIRYETLKHDVDTNRSIYESLLQKVKETSVSVALQATNVRVVDKALPPVRPYKPKHVIDLSVGALTGLILGFTLVVVRHRSDRRVRRPGVMQHYLTTRELGVIPSGRQLTPGRLPAFATPFRAMGPRDLRMWLDDPDSLLCTSFRSVMTSLVFATKNPSRARLAVVTSPGPGEGKTTIASNLAAAFAATGRRVLLVDADLRRPRLHKVFELPDSCGLREFAEEVQGAAGAAVPLDRYIQATAVPDLFVMPCGRSASSDASNLLYTLRFEEVFAALRGRFDTVLIDAPPLLAVPEVRVMTRLADGAILVVRAGSTRVDAAVAAETAIREDGGTVIGTVLNDATQSSTPYYSGYAAPTVTA